MADYTTEDIEAALHRDGELIVVLGSDAYAEKPELHIHDTSFNHDSGEVRVELSDGTVWFPASDVESLTRHKQSTADLGL
jgi:hypothetical protein